MAPETQSSSCAAFRDELTQAAWAAAQRLSAELTSHLGGCERCRAQFVANRELAASLRAALRPEPFPESRVDAIFERLERGSSNVSGFRAPFWCAAASAIAASLLAAALNPWHDVVRLRGEATPTADIVLTERDAAEIVSAMILLNWEGAAELTMHSLASGVADVAEALQRERGAQSLLPWTAAEDWDIPASAGEGARSEMTRPLGLSRAWTARDTGRTS